MKATNRVVCLTLGFLIVLLAITGCQPVLKAQPTATLEVIVENESQCTIESGPGLGGIPANDPELGEVTRAVVNIYHIDCGNPYVTEKCIDVQDHHVDEEGVLHFTSMVECVTDEGGVWKGTCDATIGKSAVCSTKGEGKYKGLQLFTDSDLNTMVMKYRVTKLAEE